FIVSIPNIFELLPYTTLFRSYFLATRNISNVVEALLSVEDTELAEDLYNQFMEKEYDQILKLSCNTAICDLTLLLKKNINQVIRDRKSTRLYSSHVSISYDVF